MELIFKESVWGLLSLPDSFVYLKYEQSAQGVSASFWRFVPAEGRAHRIYPEAYYKRKFGRAYAQILQTLDPTFALRCQAAVDEKGNALCVHPNNGAFYYLQGGVVVAEGTLRFHDAPISAPTRANGGWWGICTEKNAVVHLKMDHPSNQWDWDFFCGGEGRQVFPTPTYLCRIAQKEGVGAQSHTNERLYVCCAGGNDAASAPCLRSLRPDCKDTDIRECIEMPRTPVRFLGVGQERYVQFVDGIYHWTHSVLQA
jgi:hypothetical protein